jgi:hypothetical protein
MSGETVNVRTSARSRLAAVLAGIGSITLVLGGVAFVTAPSASAEPTTGGKNDCKSAGIPGSPLKIDNLDSVDTSKPIIAKGAKGFEVKVTLKDGLMSFDFEASRAVYGVAVKGGPELKAYKYLSGVTSGLGLEAKINPNTGKAYELSHITFCYNPCPPSTPTPTKPTLTVPTSPTIPTIPTLPTSPTVPTSPTIPTNPPSTPTPSLPTETPTDTPTATPTETPSNPVPTGTPSAPEDETPTAVIPTDVDAGAGGANAANTSGGGSGGPVAVGLLALGAALLAAGGWVVIRRRGQHSI